jgi:hypothetical protein
MSGDLGNEFERIVGLYQETPVWTMLYCGPCGGMLKATDDSGIQYNLHFRTCRRQVGGVIDLQYLLFVGKG